MQRAFTRFATFLVLLVAFTVNMVAQAAGTTVYATRTGAKYHKAGCRSLSRSQILMTLADASKRHGPCSICKPPFLQAAAAAPVAASTPRAAPPTQAVESGQCQAKTKKGTQCSRKAKAGSQYCWQHGG